MILLDTNVISEPLRPAPNPAVIVYGEFTIQVQQLQKKASISDTAKNIKTLQETANGYLQSYYAL